MGDIFRLVIIAVTFGIEGLVNSYDKSLIDLESLPPAHEIASDIVENLQNALESFRKLEAFTMVKEKSSQEVQQHDSND